MAWKLNKEYFDGYDNFYVEEVANWAEKPTKEEVLRAVEDEGYVLRSPNELFSTGDSSASSFSRSYDSCKNVHFTLFNYETWE